MTKSLSIEGEKIGWLPQEGSQREFMACPFFEVLLAGNRGGGKRLRDDVPVLTDSGWKSAGEVDYKDKLVAPDGTFTKILGIYSGESENFYKFTFNDGTTTTACRDHRWKVGNSKDFNKKGWQVFTTEKLLSLKGRYGIPFISEPVPGKKWEGFDPYVIGALLGNGTMLSKNITLYSIDKDMIDYAHKKYGWYVYKYESSKCFRAVCPGGSDQERVLKDLLPAVKAPFKHVPSELMVANPEARLALLQGLMDTDGSIEAKGNKCSFTSTSKKLAMNVADLTFSLGGKATYRWKNKISPKGGGDGYWHVSLNARNMFNPFRIKRKRDRVVISELRLRKRRYIDKIEKTEGGRGVCFSVAHDSKLFVIENYIVTHNTDVLIMDFCQHVNMGYGAAWRGVIFRETFPNLEEVIAKTYKYLIPIFNAKYNKSKNYWDFPQGERLYLRPFERPDFYWKFHGSELPWQGWEELSNHATLDGYKMMMSCCRSSHPDVPRKIRATTNPYGKGHNIIKHRFKLPNFNMLIQGEKDENGNVQRERYAISSSLSENKILLQNDPNYLDTIRTAAKNPEMLKAWIDGSWDIVAGGMFDDVWDPKIHVLMPFAIPANWRIERTMDWGSSKPFSVGWWATSDGSDVYIDGKCRSTVRGDVFRIYEWYGWTGEPNVGIKLTNSELAKGIVEREVEWGIHQRVEAGPADSAMWSKMGGPSIAEDLEEDVRLDNGKVYTGAYFIKCASKSKGSRENGWEVMRTRLKNSIPRQGFIREEPGVFIFQRCTEFIRTVPTLTRSDKNLDDIAENEGEDHIADESRYFMTMDYEEMQESTTVGV